MISQVTTEPAAAQNLRTSRCCAAGATAGTLVRMQELR
jgi:hypothetical protein